MPLEGDEAAEARYQQLLAAGMGEDALEGLVAALYDVSWRVRKLAAELLARVDATPALVDRLIHVLGDRGQTGARNAAAMALAQLGPPAVPSLLTLLQHPDPDQRKFAADILGELRQPDAVGELIGRLEDPDPNVCVAAAEALGRIGGVAAGRALERLLDSKEPLLRLCALEGLGQLSRPPPLPSLLPHLEAPETARSAWRLLGQIAHPTAFALLCRGLLTPARDAALAGLGAREVGLAADGEGELKVTLRHVEQAEGWLTQALASEERALRHGALQAVQAAALSSLAVGVAGAAEGGELAEAALKVLIRLGLPGANALLAGDPPALTSLGREARSVAGEAVLRAAEPVLVPALAALAAAGDFELAELAARALGRSRSEAAVAPLAEMLDDDLLAASAARALVTLAVTVPAQCTQALLQSLERRPRPHALRAYAQVAPPAEALAMLRRCAHEADERVRAAAAEASATLGVELLSTALADESALVRRAAARALARLAPADALPLLRRALADDEPAVLTSAAVAAGELGAKEVTATLEALLASSGAVALAALQSLFQLGVLSIGLLQSAARHADAEVVKAALTFAAGSAEGVKLAVERLQHPRWDVRVAAARTLAVSGGRETLIPLHAALERETDALTRELMMVSAARLAER
ncbi:MAG: repeat-containing lyase [Myxococcaceae bacterium]|nr:repeat-containing lyase [Myxococcaceae bacterium]